MISSEFKSVTLPKICDQIQEILSSFLTRNILIGFKGPTLLDIDKESTQQEIKIYDAGSSNDRRIIDIDAISQDRGLLSPTMVKDVFQSLQLCELKKIRPRIDYMKKVQKHINPRTREYCVDFLIYVAYQLDFHHDTLYCAVNYLDRYLSGNEVDRRNLWLVGIACLIIASKYEEVNVPDLKTYSCFTEYVFSSKDFIRMEHSILSYLKYEVTTPTTWSFLTRFVQAAQCENEGALVNLEYMASWFAELSLLSYNMLWFLPSLVAASSIFLAKYILSPSERPWNGTLQHYTLYEPSDLHDCVLALYEFYRENRSSDITDTIRMKYNVEVDVRESCPPQIPSEYFHNLN
ncbi:hypothetical protein BUALT_Bualt10G0086400 [Buddleja alternifolia]|uniref:Cyclin A n=1 Tax=Buddleja alternifolia TaxID=168488 RepID=A0AAV6X5C0_9LAMI|nr:hypothetical protein BUALT_Bualt10G0086400 [Buddleja alternifolia]